VSGFGSRLRWAGSREYETFGQLRAQWYPTGIKAVPRDLTWLDDFAVAKWMMDDGSRQKFPAQADRVNFATHSFSRCDVIRLGDQLASRYGISYFLSDDCRGRGTTLIINSGRRQQIRRMWTSIAPHMHPTMRYKLPEEFRTVRYISIPAGREIPVRRLARVVSVSPVEINKANFPSGRTGYGLRTSQGNYLARGILVDGG
jgi:hypothetical protein